MLNKDQIDRLNAQIAGEAYTSRMFLSMSCWALGKGLKGIGAFFKDHHESEEEHMHTLMDYLIQTGGKVKVGPVEAPPEEFTGVRAAFQIALEREVSVSKEITKMVDLFLQEKDYSTFTFLQTFVAEQHEEDHLFRMILEKIDLIGDDNQGIFWIDKEISNLANPK
ncbi:MAG: ferritin [Nitrospiria bacterium]